MSTRCFNTTTPKLADLLVDDHPLELQPGAIHQEVRLEPNYIEQLFQQIQSLMVVVQMT